MDMGQKLFGSLKSLVLGRGITFAFFIFLKYILFRVVEKTLLRIYTGERLNYIWES